MASIGRIEFRITIQYSRARQGEKIRRLHKLGYYLKSTNPFLANVLYGSKLAKGFVPNILDRFTGSALTGLKGSYNLDDFTNAWLRQEAYLSCSYADPQNPSRASKHGLMKNIWILK